MPMAPVDPGKSTATGALVCGIASFFCFPVILSIVAIVLGNSAMKKSQEAGFGENNNAKVGKICGIISLVLSLIGLVGTILSLALGLFSIGSLPFITELLSGMDLYY